MQEVLGQYTIIEQLGQGGMGTVYRARDSRLDRDVALKLLSPEMLADETARARLLREARLASKLNHPHIGVIYEVGEVDRQTFIAMELVKGRVLSAQIPEGGLPGESALRLGAQIADALSHAHDHGIVHRDLKSSNVMITPDERAKVLDFGLAKRIGSGADDETMEVQPTLTDTGTVVGTPHYSSPEVLRGEPATERSDIWSLGVVLYEMVTGGLPFQGRTTYEVCASIMNAPLPPLPGRVPPPLRSLIERCLDKEPGRRFQRAGEVRAALEMLQSSSRASLEGAKAAPPAWAPRLLVGALVLALAGGGGWLAWNQPWRTRELKQRQLTSNPPENPVAYGAISPDGKNLAVVDRKGIFIRSIDSGDGNALKIPDGYSLSGYPFPMVCWYPDGKQLLLTGKDPDGSSYVWALPVVGGRARRLILGAGLATISRDGSAIAYVREGKAGNDIWCSGPEGEDPRLLASSDSSGTITTWATWSPNGRRVAYVRFREGPQGPEGLIETCDLQGHARIAFLNTPAQRIHNVAISAWLPDGRLAFGLSDPPPGESEMNLWSLRVNPGSGEPMGVPSRITQWQRLSFVGPTGVSADGKRLSVGVLQYQSDCYVGDIVKGEPMLKGVKRLTLDDRFDLQPSWISDSRAILFASDRNGSMDVFRQSLDGTEPEPLVTGTGDQSMPRVSPDGAWILYKDGGAALFSSTKQAARIMRIPIRGGPPEEVLNAQGGVSFRCNSLPGAGCVMCELDKDQSVFTWFDPVRGRGKEIARTRTGGYSAWDLSPDGSTIAVMNQQGSSPRIRLVSTHGGAARDVPLASLAFVGSITWAANGQEWFVVGANGKRGWCLLRVEADGRVIEVIPPQQWMYGAAASPDGKKLVYTSNTVDGNIWLLEGF